MACHLGGGKFEACNRLNSFINLGCVHSAFHHKTYSASVSALLPIYAERFCWPKGVLLEGIDVLLLPDN